MKMLNIDELNQRAKDGTLYEALHENIGALTEIINKDEPDAEDEVVLINGVIETVGYAVVDIAESLDRIADALEEQFA